MNNNTTNNIICFACSVFQNELNKLQKQLSLLFQINYFDSMLHMFPEKLSEAVFPRVQAELLQGREALLAYGDCHPCIHDFASNKRFVKLSGMNCFQIILGDKLYKQLRREETFFLLPEWIIRWREVFKFHLGLETETIAKQFMNDFFKQIVYIDTGVNMDLNHAIQEIEAFTALPLNRLVVGLENLEKRIYDALTHLQVNRA
jgi:hypothetical protein